MVFAIAWTQKKQNILEEMRFDIEQEREYNLASSYKNAYINDKRLQKNVQKSYYSYLFLEPCENKGPA